MLRTNYSLTNHKNRRSKRYLTDTIIDADYADYLTLLTNTPAQTESLLHSQEQPTKGIGLYVNSD